MPKEKAILISMIDEKIVYLQLGIGRKSKLKNISDERMKNHDM